MTAIHTTIAGRPHESLGSSTIQKLVFHHEALRASVVHAKVSSRFMGEHSGERKEDASGFDMDSLRDRMVASHGGRQTRHRALSVPAGLEVAVGRVGYPGANRPRPHDPAETVVSIGGGSPLRP